MEAIQIQGEVRSELGKKGTKADRHAEKVPCVIYGGDKTINFTASPKELKALIYTPNFYIADIVIDGEVRKAIVKDLQFHPVTDRLLHADFQELVEGRKVKTEIPVRTVGIPAGVKNGGKLMLKVRKLKVKATPDQLVDVVEIDVAKLKMGQSFKVKDIVGVKMEILNASSIPIATVNIPRSARSAASGALDDSGEEGTEEGTEEGAAE